MTVIFGSDDGSGCAGERTGAVSAAQLFAAADAWFRACWCSTAAFSAAASTCLASSLILGADAWKARSAMATT